MDQFEKISISHLIWYLVPGLGLIFFLLFPFIVFNPQFIKVFFNTVGSFGIILLGIILGFFLDGLRLYRLRPKYSNIRKEFFQNLQQLIDPKLDPYFIQSRINDLAKQKNITGLSLHHAIWIMLGDFTLLAFIESGFWILAGLYFYFSPSCTYLLFEKNLSRDTAIIVCVFFAIFFFVIYKRFLYVSREDQNNTNKMFMEFAGRYRDEIRELLNIAPRA